VPIELSMSGVRLCDAWHAVGIVRDISERKRAEEALREKERHLSVILNAVQTALVIIDADTHTIVDVNPAAVQMVGLPKEQIVGRICHNFICPAERGQCPITDLGQDVDNSERFFLRADGTRVPCLKTVVPLVLKGKKYLLDCFVDISEQKRAEEALAEKADELARSNAELQEFAYVASHDLQEPLRMVASYVQLLQQRYGDQLDGAAEEFMEYAVDGARRMQALINDLLQYSRVGTRGKPFAPTDCEEVMNDVLANLEVSITETGAAVTHDPLPRVVADRGQLVRVFQNLIGNALKFCDATPEVHVSAGQVGGAWQFAVRDNGIGIPPEQREKVFVIFQRLHGWGEYAGTGMGLAITKKIVERHGGRIWVESEPDQGATFTFTLPNRKEPNRDTEPDDGNSDLRAVAHAAGGDSAC